MKEESGENNKELTSKQQMFCEYYIENWNASDAARRAGYSENTCGEIGYENLKKPQIKEYITEIQKDIAKIAGISRLSIVKDLIQIKDLAEQDKDQLKAIEVINKMVGFNDADKVDLTTQGESVNKTTDLSLLDDDEVLLFGKLAKKAKGFED
jgi:phage terminase small subunit